MPDTDAALMTAFLHRANPADARNDIGGAEPFNQPYIRPLDHSFGREP